MAIVQRRRSSLVGRAMTLDEFLKLPERKPYLEYEDGVVTQKMSPKGKHSRLQWTLSSAVNRETEPNRIALAFPELRTIIGGRAYVPDVAIYRWERIPRDPDGEVANEFEAPPDVVFEIASPGQSVTKLVRRCTLYVSNGVRVALLLDEKERTVLHFRPDRAVLALRGDDPLAIDDIVPGLTLTVHQVFGALRLD
jgi:Uma2 family endonuclease